MKLKKLQMLLAFVVVAVFTFTACEEDDDPTGPSDVEVPEAPTNLRATSMNSETVRIIWSSSPDEGKTFFDTYKINVTAEGGTPAGNFEYTESGQPYDISDLTEGIVYTFRVWAVNTEGEGSDTIEVEWSPATLFTTAITDEPIRMYEYTSDFGSGLEIYNNTEGGPQVLRAVSKADWDVGIDTRDDQLLFGPASEITFGTGTPESTVEMSDIFYDNIEDLDQVFDSQALSEGIFGSFTVDLNDPGLDLQKNVVFVLRIQEAGSSSWNYAKVMFIRDTDDDDYLHGSGTDNDYALVHISYQSVADVPYAFPVK
ncbi:MAG: fibronectin type III domain-containing protein [Candidatus Kapaibacterium sp.]